MRNAHPYSSQLGQNKAALLAIVKACKSESYLKFSLVKEWIAEAVRKIDGKFPALDVAKGFRASLVRLEEAEKRKQSKTSPFLIEHPQASPYEVEEKVARRLLNTLKYQEKADKNEMAITTGAHSKKMRRNQNKKPPSATLEAAPAPRSVITNYPKFYATRLRPSSAPSGRGAVVGSVKR